MRKSLTFLYHPKNSWKFQNYQTKKPSTKKNVKQKQRKRQRNQEEDRTKTIIGTDRQTGIKKERERERETGIKKERKKGRNK